MYTIGEFSRITSVTVKALRHYHSKGVLEPSYVSDDTSYRYYSEADVEKLRVVTALKLMDFNLADIKHLLTELSDETDLTAILTDRQSIIADKIQRLNLASSAID